VLKGEQIPIGARFSRRVDFLDALASDRQYRKALSMVDVIARIHEESGKSSIRRSWTSCAQAARSWKRAFWRRRPLPITTAFRLNVKVDRGLTPAAGFESTQVKEAPKHHEGGFLSSIAAARHEAQTLFELSHELGASLSLGRNAFCSGGEIEASGSL